jgi:hypothetical protein
MLNFEEAEDGGAVVGDGRVANVVDEHLVEAHWPQRRLDDVCDRSGSIHFGFMRRRQECQTILRANVFASLAFALQLRREEVTDVLAHENRISAVRMSKKLKTRLFFSSFLPTTSEDAQENAARSFLECKGRVGVMWKSVVNRYLTPKYKCSKVQISPRPLTAPRTTLASS